jgi:hypothetical protein
MVEKQFNVVLTYTPAMAKLPQGVEAVLKAQLDVAIEGLKEKFEEEYAPLVREYAKENQDG